MIKSYVYYDGSTGQVFGVSNTENKNNGEYITVDYSEIENVITGKIPTRFLSVEMDPKTKKFILKNKKNYNEILDSKDINDYLYEIPNTYTKDYDILIEQNQKEKNWIFKIGKELQQALAGAYFGELFDLSITQKRNPNIYYGKLQCNMTDLVAKKIIKIPMSEQFELDNTPISLYTDKKFDSYVYLKVPK